MSELPWTSTLQVNRLYDLLDEGLVVLDNSGVIVHSNQAFAESLQYSAGDLLDRRFDDLIAEEQKGQLPLHLAADEDRALDLTLVGRNGEKQEKRVRSLGLIEDELPKGFCLIITDCDEQCPEFKKIVASAHLKMVVVDTNLNITYVNPAFSEAAIEIIGTPVINGVGQEYRETFRQKLETAMNEGTKQELEFSESIEGKPTTWHELRIGPIREGTEIIGAVIAGYEITGRMLAMLALQESEEKFRGVFEHANDAITLADEEGKIVAINTAQENLFGIKREDVIGMPLWELQASMLSEGEKTPEYRKYLQQSLESFFESGTAPWLETKTIGEFIHPIDNSHRTFEQTSFQIPTLKGLMLCSFVRDTTEQTQLEESRRTSEHRYRALFEENNDGVFLIDLNGKFIEVNFRGAEILGFDRPEELVGQPFSQTIVEGEITESISRFEDLMGGSTIPIFERRVVKRDGTEITTEMNVSLVKDKVGNAVHVQNIMRDITEKKETEAALRQSEKRHEQALIGADLGVWEWINDPETGTESWHVTERFAEIMGYTVDELQSHFLDWSTIIHPEDYGAVHIQWERHEAKETPLYSAEYRFKTKDGKWKWVLDRGTIVEWDETGKAMKSSGTFLDITDRKEAQGALDEVRERYELALQGADLGVWDWNPESDEMIFSDRWADILGYKVDEIEPNYAGWEKLIHPDDLSPMEAKWDAHVDGITPFYSSEHRMRTKAGGWKWVLERGRVVERNEDGRTKRATGTLLDITERKVFEKALEQSEQKYRNLLENIPQRVFYKNRDSIYVAANTAFLSDLDLTLEEVVGKTDYDLYSKELADTIRVSDRKVLETLETLELDEQDFEGEEPRYTHIVKAPVRDDEGNVVGILGIYWDTTENTRAAQSLKESENNYRNLVEQSLMGIAIVPRGFESIAFVNPTICDILGYAQEEILGMSSEQVSALVHPDDVRQIDDYLNNRLKDTAPGEPIQVRMFNKDGSEIWADFSAGAIEYGDVPAVQVSIVDISKRIRAEVEVLRDRKAFRTIAEGTVIAKDTGELSQEILNGIISSLEFDFGTFRLYDEKKNVLGSAALLGIEINDTRDELPVTPEFGEEYIIVHTALSKTPDFVSDIAEAITDKPHLKRLKALNAASVVAYPLLDDNQQLLGVLSLATYSPRIFSEGDKEIFSTIVNMLSSVLERQKAEQALQISERRYRELLTDISEGIGIANLDEQFLFVNESLAKLLGYSTDELVGKSILDFVFPEDINKIREQTEVRREGKTSTYTHRFVRKDGELRTMRISAVPSRDDSGKIDGTVAIVTDITERLLKDQEIQRLNEELSRRVEERTAELAAANKELEAFSYSVSHDLRAPLRTIDGFSQALMEDYSDVIDETGRDFLRRVRVAATHMGSLIEDLLGLSRVTRAEMDRTDVDLSKMVQNIVDGFQEVDPERQIDIKVLEDVHGRCDQRLIKLVLQNLLDNAWKFTSKVPDAQIEFGSQDLQGGTIFYIKDNGAGFNMEYSDKLFVPFQRLHQVEDFEGSGIGLATVQRIINRHGGKVWAESVVGEGSTFYFTIPE